MLEEYESEGANAGSEGAKGVAILMSKELFLGWLMKNAVLWNLLILRLAL